MGKEFEKELILVFESFCWAPEPNTVVLINCTLVENKNLKTSKKPPNKEKRQQRS